MNIKAMFIGFGLSVGICVILAAFGAVAVGVMTLLLEIISNPFVAALAFVGLLFIVICTVAGACARP